MEAIMHYAARLVVGHVSFTVVTCFRLFLLACYVIFFIVIDNTSIRD